MAESNRRRALPIVGWAEPAAVSRARLWSPALIGSAVFVSAAARRAALNDDLVPVGPKGLAPAFLPPTSLD